MYKNILYSLYLCSRKYRFRKCLFNNCVYVIIVQCNYVEDWCSNDGVFYDREAFLQSVIFRLEFQITVNNQYVNFIFFRYLH